MYFRLFAAVALTAFTGPIAVQAQAGGFVATLGRDTIAIERYAQSTSAIEGTLLPRSPATLTKYSLALNADGSVSKFTQVTTRGDGSPPPNAAGQSLLIVNGQTGQWGTAYDQKKDIARIAVETQAMRAKSQERFTVTISGDKLLMTWDRGGYAVSIKEK